MGMSLDDSATMMALVSVPLLIVASFIVDLAAGHRYVDRIERWKAHDRRRLEPVHGLRMTAGHRDDRGNGQVRRFSHPGHQVGAATPASVRQSGGSRVCRAHRGL